MPADIHALCGQPVTLIRDDAALYYVHTATGTEDCPAAPGVHLQLTTPDIGISTEYSAALDKITDVLRDNLDENDEVEPIELAALVAETVGLEQLIDTLDRVRTALDRHPACDIHPDDDPVTCGWKRAVADARRALNGES
ncbi:hypothetical protein [Rhodococcus rhodochrous]|uniref:hypothetical protein n=1 Tax=Rhodococcus rhodochrous TaxID=1829 RepID=UPI0017811C6A|nr:hypothetical protein [Rhodococcus rhodochrous]QOH59849.1 hypothetical protein C6Y44_27540 [Rhodococcus rhodochrous]